MNFSRLFFFYNFIGHHLTHQTQLSFQLDESKNSGFYLHNWEYPGVSEIKISFWMFFEKYFWVYSCLSLDGLVEISREIVDVSRDMGDKNEFLKLEFSAGMQIEACLQYLIYYFIWRFSFACNSFTAVVYQVLCFIRSPGLRIFSWNYWYSPILRWKKGIFCQQFFQTKIKSILTCMFNHLTFYRIVWRIEPSKYKVSITNYELEFWIDLLGHFVCLWGPSISLHDDCDENGRIF